jgi:hypothetical protein
MDLRIYATLPRLTNLHTQNWSFLALVIGQIWKVGFDEGVYLVPHVAPSIAAVDWIYVDRSA